MVDLVDRAEREAALARRLGKANAEARRVFLQAIEDGAISDEEWRAISGAYQTALQMGIEETVLSSGMAAAEASVIGIDSAALHARAITFARDYSFDLVSKLEANSRRMLQESVTDYFSQRLTLADLEQRLTTAFGPVRAEMIAVSEVTRAAAQGEIEFAKELQQMGLQPVLVWNTANDSLACPLCGPLNGKAQGDGWINPPPQHPRCRCTLSTELRGATR